MLTRFKGSVPSMLKSVTWLYHIFKNGIRRLLLCVRVLTYFRRGSTANVKVEALNLWLPTVLVQHPFRINYSLKKSYKRSFYIHFCNVIFGESLINRADFTKEKYWYQDFQGQQRLYFVIRSMIYIDLIQVQYYLSTN